MSESNNDSKDDYEFISIEILDKAVVFCDSNEFQNKKSDFENKHAKSFYTAAESKTPEMDQDIILYSLFQEYQALLDDLFTRFADDNNTTSTVFFEVCYILNYI
jgi:hypothetical protein